MTKAVVVTDYDPAWPEAFHIIRQELEKGLGELAIDIVHVGSTSVPGLAAKPIIDLDVVIVDETPLDAVIHAMEELGYYHQGDLGIAGREAFGYKEKTNLCKHHLYVCRESSRELKRHVVFRDYLRTHPREASEYATVKLKAASLYPDSIDDYMRYKDDCIKRLYIQCGLEK